MYDNLHVSGERLIHSTLSKVNVSDHYKIYEPKDIKVSVRYKNKCV